MALREYLTTEVGEDWVDGLITRREAVRRLALLGMTASSASALLAACAAQISPARATSGAAITFAGRAGELQGFLAPAASPAGAMLVIHENMGLTDHIRSVASRLAA